MPSHTISGTNPLVQRTQQVLNEEAALREGLRLEERVPMPANNQTLVWRQS